MSDPYRRDDGREIVTDKDVEPLSDRLGGLRGWTTDETSRGNDHDFGRGDD